MKKPTINFRKLRKHSEIYRKAAELLHYHATSPSGYLTGCCSAFDEINSLALEKVLDLPVGSNRLELTRDYVYDLEEVVDEAISAFSKMYQPKGKPLFWFGENFNEKEQNHRITALLLMADISESEGM